jgi:hypothetical protein
MLVLPLGSSDLAAESWTNDWVWESETQFRKSGTASIFKVSLLCLFVHG